MNKYRIDGRQLLLKLAQPKFRAPRQGRGSQSQAQSQPYSGYDAPSYHSQPQNQVFFAGSCRLLRRYELLHEVRCPADFLLFLLFKKRKSS